MLSCRTRSRQAVGPPTNTCSVPFMATYNEKKSCSAKHGNPLHANYPLCIEEFAKKIVGATIITHTHQIDGRSRE